GIVGGLNVWQRRQLHRDAKLRELPVDMSAIAPRAPQSFPEPVGKTLLVTNIVDRVRQFPVGGTIGPEAQNPSFFARQVIPLAARQRLQDLCVVGTPGRDGFLPLCPRDIGGNVDPFIDNAQVPVIVEDTLATVVFSEDRDPEIDVPFELGGAREPFIGACLERNAGQGGGQVQRKSGIFTWYLGRIKFQSRSQF